MNVKCTICENEKSVTLPRAKYDEQMCCCKECGALLAKVEEDKDEKLTWRLWNSQVIEELKTKPVILPREKLVAGEIYFVKSATETIENGTYGGFSYLFRLDSIAGDNIYCIGTKELFAENLMSIDRVIELRLPTPEEMSSKRFDGAKDLGYSRIK